MRLGGFDGIEAAWRSQARPARRLHKPVKPYPSYANGLSSLLSSPAFIEDKLWEDQCWNELWDASCFAETVAGLGRGGFAGVLPSSGSQKLIFSVSVLNPWPWPRNLCSQL